MSYQRDREAFLVAVAAEGVPLEVARKVLREATTLQRLAVAQCNGDWPCDNGSRTVQPCAQCERGYVPSVLRQGGICPDCRAERRVTALLAPFGITPIVQGDPRGCVLKLKLPSGRTDDGNREGFCVPTR